MVMAMVMSDDGGQYGQMPNAESTWASDADEPAASWLVYV
jgi:hypothetical protein